MPAIRSGTPLAAQLLVPMAAQSREVAAIWLAKGRAPPANPALSARSGFGPPSAAKLSVEPGSRPRPVLILWLLTGSRHPPATDPLGPAGGCPLYPIHHRKLREPRFGMPVLCCSLSLDKAKRSPKPKGPSGRRASDWSADEEMGPKRGSRLVSSIAPAWAHAPPVATAPAIPLATTQ